MSDEAHFHLNGFVNKQNFRIWGLENPREIMQHESHPLYCTVWAGITSEEIIGPYFLEDEKSTSIRVNSDSYSRMIRNFLVPRIIDKPDMWFQQDGVTGNISRNSMNILR
jgi:hypothetical protein